MKTASDESSPIQHFVARQPIFDRKQKVYAYELLFRSGLDNFFAHADGDEASSRVITDSFLLFGLEEVTGGAKAFINFTRGLLVKEYALSLPKRFAVVEILETVEPDSEVIEACRRLKANGYELALDDFVYAPSYKPLLELTDIVKVDFLHSPEEEVKKLAKTLLPKGIKLLAEKVETRGDFERALALGYIYFQGYFFSRPVIISRKAIPVFKLQLLRLLREINRPDIDFKMLAKTIEAEVSISLKLLKFINAAAFGLRRKVASILQALTLLGEKEVRNWASLLTLSGLATDKPAELVVTSLLRAKLAESVAGAAGLAQRSADLFLLGLFSLLDAMVDRPMEEILADIPLADDIKDALLGRPNRLRLILDLVLAFEKGAWSALSEMAAQLQIKEESLPPAYAEAMKWLQEISVV
ncbi:MAG: HDOD domain-containing protein [Thermodesulfobacteriota bacterium]